VGPRGRRGGKGRKKVGPGKQAVVAKAQALVYIRWHDKAGASAIGGTTMQVGFIGTGRMGNPMARNLIRAGHQLVVHDARPEAAQNLLELGAQWAGSPRLAAEACCP